MAQKAMYNTRSTLNFLYGPVAYNLTLLPALILHKLGNWEWSPITMFQQ